jgi:hypothetical protein
MVYVVGVGGLRVRDSIVVFLYCKLSVFIVTVDAIAPQIQFKYSSRDRLDMVIDACRTLISSLMIHLRIEAAHHDSTQD